MNTWRKLGE